MKASKQQLANCKNNYNVIVKAGPKNKDAVLIGGSDLTVDNGFPIYPGEVQQLPNFDYDTIYYLGTEKDSLCLLIWR